MKTDGPAMFSGKFQTDYEQYLVVQCVSTVFSMYLNHKVENIEPYIAIAVMEFRDELPNPSIVDDQTGFFIMGTINQGLTVTLYDTPDFSNAH